MIIKPTVSRALRNKSILLTGRNAKDRVLSAIMPGFRASSDGMISVAILLSN